jgi:ABC-type multidrug transport system permease subunit
LIRTLLKKDFRRRLKNPGGYILLILSPVIWTLFIGLIFGPSKKENILPKIKLLIEDHDASFASRMFVGAFSNKELAAMFEVTVLDDTTGRALMDQGKASALVIIPQGFGDSLLTQKQSRIIVVKNPSESFLPKVAEETVLILGEAGERFSYLSSEPLRHIREESDKSGFFSDNAAATIAVKFNQIVRKASTYLFPPLIRLETETVAYQKEHSEQQTTMPVLLAYLLCGISLMMLFFTIDALARDIFLESEKKTMYRIIVSPVGARRFVVGKLTFIYVSALMAYLLIWIIGVVFLSIRIRQILLFLAFSALVLAVLTGIIGLIYASVKNRNQGAAVAPAVILPFCLLGGSMIPLSAMPPLMKKIAAASPVYWGVDGLHQIIIANAAVDAIALHIGILLVLALLLNTLAFFIFEKKIRA